MSRRIPQRARYVVVGAGVHGLSTAWHLARELRRRGTGSGEDVLVVDKAGIGAGASGIACGVVRNNYFQPAMRELMAHSVDVWESDPEAFSYHPNGYLQISPEVMRADVAAIHAEQQAIGYASTFVEGERDTRAYLRGLFGDWHGEDATSVLHEHRGGFANNMASMRGLAAKALAAGVQVVTGVTVTGFVHTGDEVRAVRTDAGDIACEQVVVAAGPWVRDVWSMLGLPARVKVLGAGGFEERPTWTYWALQEGTLAVDPGLLARADGGPPPVVHVDSCAPLRDPDGARVTQGMWGVYFKPDTHFGGVQGGAVPHRVERDAAEVDVDPYGPASPDFVVGADFARLWTSALSHCLARFEGLVDRFSRNPSGGLGCFTPDSFPVFDRFCGNVTVLADSNHGYKMIGVGALAAREVCGETQPLLEPFRWSRFAAGRTHPVSHSPFPWS